MRRLTARVIAAMLAIDPKSPLTWIVLFVAVLHVVGIGWGLPASDGWDNDGVAPRDFLPGLADTFTPGRFYTYPPVHLALLAVLTSPITIAAVVKAPSSSVADIVHEIIKVPYMTAIAYVARFVSLAMSLAIVVIIARIAEEIRAHSLGLTSVLSPQSSGPPRREHHDVDPRIKRAGWCAAALVGINASFNYYAHTSNLDVPYLFWATWALLVFTRAITRDEPRLLRRAFALAVLAIGTKDQAYAMFLLALPLALLYWLATAKSSERPAILKQAGIAIGLAILLFLIVDCVIVNPSGFQARVAFLTGSASQDYSEYTNDWSGRIRLLKEASARFWFFYPNVFAILVAGGFLVAMRETRRATERIVTLLPLLVVISFTITFNFTARRTDARFLLPQSIMFAIYGGLAIERLVFAAQKTMRLIGQAAISIAFALGIFTCIAVDASFIFDPRYDAEAWLMAHTDPGDVIETYGNNVYMPRLTSVPNVHVTRVSPDPIDKRNPMPDVEEIQGLYEDAPKRKARFIVVSTGWVWRYLPDNRPPGDGKQIAPTQARSAADQEATTFFDELVRSVGKFQIVHDAKYDDRYFPIVNVHGSTTRWIWIYERKPARAMDPEKWPPVP